MTTAGPGDESTASEIFLVAAEASGDRLGVALMRALRERAGRPLRFCGVGGREMTAAGFENLHAMDDFAIIGFSAIPRRLPRILKRMFATVRAVLARKPDVLVVIDSPSYSLWVARLVRLIDRTIPIVDYVSPSVWGWRPGRAKSMRRYIDHVLALLPFEPDVHRRLGGPPCTYVGHPLIEEVAQLRPNQQEAERRRAKPPIILALPGSRSGEVTRLAEIFGRTLGIVAERAGPIELIVPTVPFPRRTGGGRDRRLAGPAAHRHRRSRSSAAFRSAHAALAKSGTVTLELALAGVPMVAAYLVSDFEEWVGRRLILVKSIILANLVIGEDVVPQMLQADCTPQRLAAELLPLIGDTPERQRQLDAFARLDAIMEIGTRSPAGRAADIVLGVMRQPRSPMAATAANR